MKVYLGAPHTYQQVIVLNMKLYLAGTCTRPYVMDEYMKIFLAGQFPCDPTNKGVEAMKLYLAESGAVHKTYIEPAGALKHKICILESFYYVKDWMIPYINNYWDFILDSGAFTFMQNGGAHINWEQYVDKYGAFIKEHKIKHYFELDIDSIVGLKKVKQLRKRLESITGTKCIPVWHKERGKENWLKIVKEYKYVAIGGIVTKEIKGNQYPIFTWLLNEAKKQNCKVHGLGFTRIKSLKRYHFYSVDSTAWIYGNRGGFLYKFTGDDIAKINKPEGSRIKVRETAIHNFNEWVKFQEYAERCL